MFTSSNTSVVTVSGRTNTINNEIVKSTVTLNGVGYGTATITVSSKKNPSWSKSCSVYVYCGGTAYKDVTRHNMILNNYGYYNCTACYYTCKSPALQDKNVLSTEDYLKVISLIQAIPCHATLRDEGSNQYINPELLMLYVDQIRSKEEYAGKYEYSDENNNYVAEFAKYTCDEDLISDVLHGGFLNINYATINNGFDKAVYDGTIENLIVLILGFLVPAEYSTIFAALSADSGIDMAASGLGILAARAGYPEISYLIDLISFGSSIGEDIQIDDKIIEISTINYGYTQRFVYNSNGDLKCQSFLEK